MPGADGDNDKPNDRIKTREFYQFQKDMRDEMRDGFDDLGKQVSSLDKQVAVAATQREIFIETCQQNRDDITSIKRRSNYLDAGVLLVSAAWTGLITFVTNNK